MVSVRERHVKSFDFRVVIVINLANNSPETICMETHHMLTFCQEDVGKGDEYEPLSLTKPLAIKVSCNYLSLVIFLLTFLPSYH